MARPTLARIRRRPPLLGDAVEARTPRLEELSHSALTWVHLERPGPLDLNELGERFAFHELDV